MSDPRPDAVSHKHIKHAVHHLHKLTHAQREAMMKIAQQARAVEPPVNPQNQEQK